MTKDNGKRIGIKDIAEKAGVSIGTVDRVLHMRGDVSEATKAKVLEIVEECGYTPNVIARTLSSKKQLKIGIVIPDSSDHNPYWEMPIQGISKAAGELSRFNTRIIHEFFDASDESSFREAFNKVLVQEPDGLVLNPVFGHNSLEQIRQLDEAGIPYVSIEVNVEGIDKLGHFGQDARQSGRVAASLVATGVPEMLKGAKLAEKGKMPELSEAREDAKLAEKGKMPELPEIRGGAKVAELSEKTELPEVLIIKQTSKKLFSKHIEARISGFLEYFKETGQAEDRHPDIQQGETSQAKAALLKLQQAEVAHLKAQQADATQAELPKTEAKQAKDRHADTPLQIRPVIVEIDLSLKGEPETTLEQTLAQHPDIKAVFVPNSRAFLVAGFIEKRDLEGYFVVGYDIIEQNTRHLEKGTISFLIGQRPHVQAYNAIMALSEHLLTGKQIAPTNYSQIDIINKENITYYKNN